MSPPFHPVKFKQESESDKNNTEGEIMAGMQFYMLDLVEPLTENQNFFLAILFAVGVVAGIKLGQGFSFWKW